ncbi:MAG: GNAT family N-acetyltransferase [Clostridia bacterium]|nr:GNAT family N-acetyltransferase [Clostridia bacterium]
MKAENKVVGAIKLNPDNNRGKYYAKAISFVLSPFYWGKGIMTESVKRVIRYAFDEVKIDLLSAFHYSENHRSKKLWKNADLNMKLHCHNPVKDVTVN